MPLEPRYSFLVVQFTREQDSGLLRGKKVGNYPTIDLIIPAMLSSMNPEFVAPLPHGAGVLISGASLPRRPLLVFHVDDNNDDHLLFQTATEEAKLPMVWQAAASAEKAITHLENLLMLSRTERVHWPDLLVLDVVLPGGSGLKVLEFVRSKPELRYLPVVVLTGSFNPAIAEKSLMLGADAFLDKPLSFEKILTLVTSLYKICKEKRLRGIPQSTGTRNWLT